MTTDPLPFKCSRCNRGFSKNFGKTLHENKCLADGAAKPPIVPVVPVVEISCAKCRRFHDGDCPPAPTTAELPVTGAVVPAAAATLRIKITGSMMGHEGEAFTADVFDGKVRRGVIENTGNGGGTDFIHLTAADMQWFDNLANEYAAISEDNAFLSHESLCNDLIEEVMLTRDLDRKRNAVIRVKDLIRKGTGFETGTYDGGDNGIRIINSPLNEGTREWARTQGKDVEVWIKGKGWETA